MQRLVAVVAAAALISGWVAFAGPAETAATSVFEDGRDGDGGSDANDPTPIGSGLGRGASDVGVSRSGAATRASGSRASIGGALAQAPKTSPPASS